MDARKEAEQKQEAMRRIGRWKIPLYMSMTHAVCALCDQTNPKKWPLSYSKCRLCRIEQHMNASHTSFMTEFNLLPDGPFKNKLIAKIRARECNEHADLRRMVLRSFEVGQPVDREPSRKKIKLASPENAGHFQSGIVFGVTMKDSMRPAISTLRVHRLLMQCFPTRVSSDNFTGSNIVYGLPVDPLTSQAFQLNVITNFVSSMPDIEFTEPNTHACIVKGPFSWEQRRYDENDSDKISDKEEDAEEKGGEEDEEEEEEEDDEEEEEEEEEEGEK